MTTAIELSAADARHITDQIKTGVEAVWHLITQAYTSRAWAILGYVSWDDYCTREFGTSRIRLPREDRQEVVASLRESGLSIRAIAAATGEGRDTVSRELAGVRNRTPGDEAPRPITGTDGKTYTPPAPRPIIDPQPAPQDHRFIDADELDAINQPRPDADFIEWCDQCSTNADSRHHSHDTPEPAPAPEPAAPKRRPITDQIRDAGWELRKAIERLERLAADDRFDTHKSAMAPQLRSHLTNAIDVCQDLIDRTNN